LSLHANIHHFWQAYGGWTFALSDYYVLNFTRQLDDPATQQVRKKQRLKVSRSKSTVF
jgi:hypothetical protein